MAIMLALYGGNPAVPSSMLDTAGAIEAGRRAFAASDWTKAYEQLASARAEAALGVDDLALLTRAAWVVGRIPECLDLSEDVFRGYVDEDRPSDAAMTALRLALGWFTRGDMSAASGWLGRARRILAERDDLASDPARGYLAYLDGLAALESTRLPDDGDLHRLAELAAALRDPALESLSLALSGLVALRTGDTTRGFALLDEAMLPVVAGRVPVEWAGDVYCTVIHICHELADFRRMSEWTSATERWCRPLASEAFYGGICRVHRLELRSARGEWEAIEEQLAAESERLLAFNGWVAGAGYYQLGEIRRMRGDGDAANAAYASARAVGVDPQPGAALLLLEAGQVEQAWAAAIAALEGRDRIARARLLRAGVEIGLAAGRVDEAEALCRELRAAAADYDSRGFAAWASHAEGMVAVARGRPAEALEPLADAAAAFRRGAQPYETASVLAWIARAHALAGSPELASRAHAEARDILNQLGVERPDDPDRAAATRPNATATATAARGDVSGIAPDIAPLTAREAEVLEQVARGASNRDVAAALFISEKTVGRHLANVYAKLGVGSRTAAAAWWRDRLHGSP
ncbi:LuxR family transcriptional regulator [Agromyces protaetiae]|uniref:LuxR family transcriptional regulator n=1 Tax=Agromyces protaetiae TaxID=2509455 RepID=A0A4P6F963_9MICO|nr:LuxR C-terminal-related transcriptional regulator [Agromyces protaetiae]QAY72314.1 LuxR family transcriptional regulator [Agromyces protaetiae]